MHTIIHPLNARRPRSAPDDCTAAKYRKPAYEYIDQGPACKLVVYIPGVDAAGVDIEARRSDLTITAKKVHFVRVNWQCLHLENAQRDYRLRLRLGDAVDYSAMHAEIHDGMLTVTLPKKSAPADAAVRLNVA